MRPKSSKNAQVPTCSQDYPPHVNPALVQSTTAISKAVIITRHFLHYLLESGELPHHMSHLSTTYEWQAYSTSASAPPSSTIKADAPLIAALLLGLVAAAAASLASAALAPAAALASPAAALASAAAVLVALVGALAFLRLYVSSHLLPCTLTVSWFLALRVPLKGVPVVKLPAALKSPAVDKNSRTATGHAQGQSAQ